MTTPTGQISLNDVNVELGLSGTTTISMNQTNVRTLAGVASGQISMQNLQGKSNRVSISYTYSANTANASLNVTSIGGYSAGKSDITITVNSGVYLYSTSTGTPGLSLSGGSSGDTITLVNNGYIMGMGGTGGSGYNAVARVGDNGGTALSLGFATTINNTNASAYIGGGGGGGASCYGGTGANGGGGGGVGGGAGGASGTGGYNGAGGSGGSVGSSGGNGSKGYPSYYFGGGGGGRVFPGVGASGGRSEDRFVGAGGTGGGSGATAYDSNCCGTAFTGAAGSGGGWGASGGTSYSSPVYGGIYYRSNSGGSGNSAGGNASVYSGPSLGLVTSGGAGGKAVALNGNSVTWVSGNTTRVYGTVS